MLYTFAVYFYLENAGFWRELERLFSEIVKIKAKSQEAAIYEAWSSPMTIKGGGRRCFRRFDLRGKP